MQTKLERFLATRRRVLQGGLALGATAAMGSPALARPDTAINFVGWQFQPQIVEENVAIFEGIYDENVDYELVSGDYHPIAETKLIGGQQIDMLYAEEDRITRWHAAGWIRDLEGLPGVDEIKAGLYPASLSSLSLPDGRFAGMPYYAGHLAFLYNGEALDEAGIEVPTTLDEVLEACRKLKGDGLFDTPFNGSWGQNWPELSWSLFGNWFAEGAVVFDEDSNFVDDAALRRVLEFYRTLYAERLVLEDIMTLPNEGIPAFASGRHVFHFMHDYNQSVVNNPEFSQIAGKVRNALMPGATQETFGWTACYLMGANADPDRVWNMLQFFGGKAEDGEYHVCKRWALEFGLGSGHMELMADPDVVAAFSQWRDLDVTNQQIAKARSRSVSKEIWFPEWDMFMMQRVQDYIRGTGSTDDIVALLADRAASLKAEYN